MKNILLLLILFTGLVSWGQDYDIYLNSFHSEDQSKTFQKFTYKIPEHVNSVQLNFDPRVVPDAFYVKYGDQEFWSGFVGDIYKKGGGLYKMMSVPENIKNRYYKDIYPSNLYENQKNENSRIVDAFPRNFVGELVWYKQNDGLLEFINTEISQVGGNSINSIFKNGDGNAENITNGIKNTQTPLRDIYDSYGNVLKGETSFTLKKESGEDEITIMVFSPLHGRLFDVLINTCETCQEPTKDISEIEFKDSKILLNGSTYDGLVTERYNQEQLKSVKRVKNGLITSEIIYHEDKNYKSNLSNFKNIEVITSKTEQLGIMDYQIDKLIKEGENQLSQRDHLKENEMGDKFEKYQEKYNEGNLKGKKLELFNAYLKHKNNYEETTKKIKSDKKSRDEFKNSLFKEMKKPFYQLVSKESFNYTNGQKTGVHKEYDKNEKLVLEEELKDGVRNGSYKRYEGDVIVEEGTYSNGLMTGEWIFRHDNGNLKGQGNYVNGDGENVGSSGVPQNGRDGEWILYHENGKKAQSLNYKNSQPEGEFLSYYTSGILKEKKYFVNGLLHGNYEQFYNGNLDLTGFYNMGQREGIWYRYGEVNWDGLILKTKYLETYEKNEVVKNEFECPEINTSLLELPSSLVEYDANDVELINIFKSFSCLLRGDYFLKNENHEKAIYTYKDGLNHYYNPELLKRILPLGDYCFEQGHSGHVLDAYRNYLKRTSDVSRQNKYDKCKGKNAEFMSNYYQKASDIVNDMNDDEIIISSNSSNTIVKGYVYEKKYSNNGRLDMDLKLLCPNNNTTIRRGWYSIKNQGRCQEDKVINCNQCNGNHIFKPCSIQDLSEDDKF